MKTSNLLFSLMAGLMFASFSSGFSPILGYADEVMLILAFGFLIIKFALNRKAHKFTLFLIAYLIYSFTISALSQFKPNLIYSILQSLIHAKLFIVAYASVQLYNSSKISEKITKRLFFVFVTLFALGVIINYSLGAYWNSIFSSDPAQYRYGFIRPAGFFGHYAPNGYFFSLALITLLMLSTKTPEINKAAQIRKFYAMVIIDFLAAFPLTVRKGLFMIIPYGMYIISLLNPTRRTLFITAATIFLIAFFFLVSGTTMYEDTASNLANFFSSDHAYIRGLIVYYGFSLFADFFPIGVGNGLYGTYFSNMNFSVYEYVGLNPEIFIRDNGALSGVYDSGISALMAESGFIGCAIFALIIFHFFKYNKKNLDEQNYRIFKIITSFSLILSITEPVWQNGFFTTFFTICLLYIYTKNNKFRVSGRWIKQETKQIQATKTTSP